MERKTVTYNREKLYEEVWNDPVTVVAKRYGISDVALHKTCKKLNVPVPQRGYWAQVRTGVKIPKTPLPKTKGPAQFVVERVEDNKTEQKRVKVNLFEFLDAEIRDKVEDVCSKIIVPDNLNRPHKLVSDAERTLRKRKVQVYSTPVVHADIDILDIDVTQASLGRALRIMDSIIKAIEKIGFIIVIDRDKRGTFVNVQGELIQIRLRERLKRVDHVLTPEEQKKKKEGKYFYAPNYDFLPTGEFILHNECWWADRKNWQDSIKKKVEDYLGEFIIGIVHTANYIKKRHAQEEQERERRRQEEIRRAEIEALRKDEMSKFEALESVAMDWRRAKIIREYVEALEQEQVEEHTPDEKGRLLEYLKWAKEKADWLDPLIAKEDPILGKRHNY